MFPHSPPSRTEEQDPSPTECKEVGPESMATMDDVVVLSLGSPKKHPSPSPQKTRSPAPKSPKYKSPSPPPKSPPSETQVGFLNSRIYQLLASNASLATKITINEKILESLSTLHAMVNTLPKTFPKLMDREQELDLGDVVIAREDQESLHRLEKQVGDLYLNLNKILHSLLMTSRRNYNVKPTATETEHIKRLQTSSRIPPRPKTKSEKRGSIFQNMTLLEESDSSELPKCIQPIACSSKVFSISFESVPLAQPSTRSCEMYLKKENIFHQTPLKMPKIEV
ncbi:hypothetical protein L6452_30793 [Arctium lappa]|uniref:Uncharacterized protein n=1 Tax=Arctium lappa TaxID=4217 RepID=A0ACB8ZIR0_ARCLA|nr:hypothetical protein L6452_30793 [Arctium lappa]